jgi:hypothetical protein
MSIELKLFEQLNIPHFNKRVECKVDTGASVCCIHGTDIKVDEGSRSVSFSNPDLSDNRITMPIASVMSVQTADNGSDERPVILLDVELGGARYEKVHFNVNDRSQMDSKVLVGQNLLKLGDFVVSVDETAQVSDTVDTPTQEFVVEGVSRFDPETQSFTVNIRLTPEFLKSMLSQYELNK